MSTAVAHANIALVKYWGKRDAGANLPAVGSISITLGALSTRTTVTLGGARDAFTLDATPASPEETARVTAFLDRVRPQGAPRAHVESTNDFPTGAGLASSASGFAALALAASHAYGADLAPPALSRLARLGSGSAARSIFGGFVELPRGERADGEDCVARSLLDGAAWPLQTHVVLTSEAKKPVGSTGGMQRSQDTSPYYRAWVDTHPADLRDMREAILSRDFQRVAELAEASCLKMHAVMLTTQPALLYWNAATVELIHAVRGLRQRGLGVFFTIDAGPQVKVACLPNDAAAAARELARVPGVLRLITSPLGPAAHLA